MKTMPAVDKLLVCSNKVYCIRHLRKLYLLFFCTKLHPTSSVSRLNNILTVVVCSHCIDTMLYKNVLICIMAVVCRKGRLNLLAAVQLFLSFC